MAGVAVRDDTDTLVSDLGQLEREIPESSTAGVDLAATASSGFSLTFLGITELLWKRRRAIARSTLAFLLLFAMIAFLIPKRYTATTRLMPPDYGSNSALALALPALGDQGEGGSGSGTGILGLASQLLGMNSSGDLFVGIIKSETVEDGVIGKLGLMKVYSEKYLEDARKRLESNTQVESEARTGIISIAVEDKNPERAAAIAKAYVNELNQVLAQVNASSAHRERVFLEERLQEIKQQSDSDAKEFALFASQNAAIDIPSQAKAMVVAGAELQSELIVAQSELKGLQQIFADGNARVKAAKARVDELQRQVDKFGGKGVNPATDSSLGQNELYPSVRQLPLLGVKYLDLYRRTKIDEAIIELLTKEYEIAKIEEARSVPTAQVLDAALVPQKKSSPHRLIIMLVGIFLGFCCSTLCVVGRTVWAHTDSSSPAKLLVLDIYSTVKQEVTRWPMVLNVSKRMRR